VKRGSRIGDRMNPVPDAVSVVPPDAAVAAGARSLPFRRRRRFSWAPYALVLPVVVAMGIVLGYPIVKLVSISFQRYGLFELIQHRGVNIGLKNYGSVKVSKVIRLMLMSGLVLVWAMPVVVAVQVWYWMTNFENGVITYLLSQLHLVRADHDWYATPFSQLAMVTLLIVWGALPFVIITVYAGLAQVPDELVEAAEIDGAGPLRIFRDVTFPVLKPILLIVTSLSIIWDFGVFAQPYLLIGSSHVDATNYLMGVYVFIEGYGKHDFGRGAAISLLMLLMVALLSVVYVRQMVRAGDIDS
jgi:N,N'-diacetylchitobiose transport system permease protein